MHPPRSADPSVPYSWERMPALFALGGAVVAFISLGLRPPMQSANNDHGGAEDDQHPVLAETERQLREYFSGRRKEFSVALDMRGTRFQKAVWEALLAIPFGQTKSYGQLAKQLGNPRATRAVGAANGRNPISIIVPCHRVIGSSGKLTGFAGGLEVKAHLLSLEK